MGIGNHRPIATVAMQLVLATVVVWRLYSPVEASEPSHAQPQTVASDKSTAVIQGTVYYEADRGKPWRYARYYVQDREEGQLAEAVVALTGRSLRREKGLEETKTVVIDQKNFRFDPETVAIHAGDRVKFTNSDNAVHNVRTTHPLHSFNVNMRAGGEHLESFMRAGGLQRPYQIGCDYHSSMRAWVFVLAHPYFQVTKQDGRFRLTNVPPGEYKLEMVHPAGKLRWSQQVTGKAGKTTQLEIRVTRRE